MNLPGPGSRFYQVLVEFQGLLAEISDKYLNDVFNSKVFDRVLAQLQIYEKNPNDLLDKFITESYVHWKLIAERSVYFFPIASKIFNQMSLEGLVFFEILYNTYYVNETKKQIDQAYLDEIWTYFHALVRISINHVHEKRSPILVEKKFTIRIHDTLVEKIIDIPIYATMAKGFPTIDLDEAAKGFKVERIFRTEDEPPPNFASFFP